jgi:hypothetical protein
VKSFARHALVLGFAAASVLAAACSSSNSKGDDDDHDSTGSGGSGNGAAPATGGSDTASGGSGASGGGGNTGGSGATRGSGATAGAGGAQGGGATGGQGTGGGEVASGGSGATAGASGTPGGAGAAAGQGTGAAAGAGAGTTGSAGSSGSPSGGLGSAMQSGTGTSSERYATEMVSRNDVPYILITNGWGPGFQSHTVSWNGTSFTVEAMEGMRGSGGQPASYPSVFCGHYSVQQVPDCGLPKAIDQIKSLRTGWRWSANGNTGPYNAAYDIWLGTDTGFGMYLMVWLRDPPTEQPAGSPDPANQGVTVANAPGVWNIWSGTVNNRPIINWVRAEGSDSSEIEFDVMDFIRDAQARGLTITGTQVNAVAVGFEIWQGPITNLKTEDFYVDVQ